MWLLATRGTEGTWRRRVGFETVGPAPPFFIESNVNYDARTPGDIRTGFSDVIGAGDLTGPRTGSAPFYQARAWDLDLRPQFTNQFNFSLEYQLARATSLSVGYVGTSQVTTPRNIQFGLKYNF